VHATLKNLELLAETTTVTEAIAAACARKVVTVQPWLENRDGKRFLHLPPTPATATWFGKSRDSGNIKAPRCARGDRGC